MAVVYEQGLDESQFDPRVVTYLKSHFAQAADFMRNQSED